MKKVAAYGSLYLDRGERMAVAKEQIRDFARMDDIAGFYFDVIGSPAQRDMGEEYVELITAYARRRLPGGIEIVVAFTEANDPGDDPRWEEGHPA